MYAAGVGTFLQRDPLGQTGSAILEYSHKTVTNLIKGFYEYCTSSPVIQTDPEGLLGTASQRFYDCRSECEDECWKRHHWTKSLFLIMACVDTCKTECTKLNPNTLSLSGASCVQQCVSQFESAIALSAVGAGIHGGVITVGQRTVPNPMYTGGGFRGSLNMKPTILTVISNQLPKGIGSHLANDQIAIHKFTREINNRLASGSGLTGAGRVLGVTARVIQRGCQWLLIIEAPVYVYCSTQCMSSD